MKAKDFRIGNLIVDYKGDVVPVEAIEILAMQQCEVSNTAIEFIQPIFLTEEWLLKLGFERSISVTHSSGEPVEFNVYKKGDLTYNTIQQAWWLRGIMNHFPNYVHELQNLVFALTGEELVTKQ